MTDPILGQVEITVPVNGPAPEVIRFWCGRCYSEISGPASECRVCAASAAEVARHHTLTVHRRVQ